MTPEHQGNTQTRGWQVWCEDALILLCLALLWLPILGCRGPIVSVVMVGCLVTMTAVLVRRKRRVDRLFEELQRSQEEQEAVGMTPIPGVVPPPHLMAGQPPPTATVSRDDPQDS